MIFIYSMFTESAQHILQQMKKEMFLLKHPYVGTEHLLLAILHNDYLDITKELLKYDLSYDRFRNEIISIIGVGNKENNIFLYTPMLKRVIDNCMSISKDNDTYIEVSDLFISLLEEGEGIANRILLGMNIDIDFLYEKFKYNSKICNKSKLIISDFSYDMNDKYRKCGYDPVLGREDEVNRVIEILLRRTKCNPILVGDAGVGKTAIVEELVRRIENKNVPNKLMNCHILCLSLSSLIAGTKYRGEFEERINQMISEIDNDPNIILFIDEIHTLVGAGGAEGAIDASNILKPYLARGNLKVIGATTSEEYSKYIENEKALARRFQKILVNELNINDMKNIFYNIRNIYEEYHSVIISDNIIDLILSLTSKYLVNGKFPDKAIDVLDEVCTKASIYEDDFSDLVHDYEKKLNSIRIQKNNLILCNSFKEADELRNKEKLLFDEYINYSNSLKSNKKKEIIDDIVYKCIYDKTKIPLSILKEGKMEATINDLKSVVVGQDNVIDELFNSVYRKYKLINDTPFTCLLVGKSGVGKTFLVQEVAKRLVDMSFFVRFNSSELNTEYGLSKFIGVAPGYVGYKENNSLVDRVRSNPFQIVLFDDIENCGLVVKNILLEIIETGKYNCLDGSVVDFRHVIFFFTSKGSYSNIGFICNDENKRGDFANIIDSNFIDKIDCMLKCNDLDADALKKIICNMCKNNLSTEVVDKIILKCDYKKFGAKKVNKLVNDVSSDLVNV